MSLNEWERTYSSLLLWGCCNTPNKMHIKDDKVTGERSAAKPESLFDDRQKLYFGVGNCVLVFTCLGSLLAKVLVIDKINRTKPSSIVILCKNSENKNGWEINMLNR